MPDYSGSFSGSFEGNGNKLTNIDYYSLSNLPASITPFQKNSILANNSLRDNFVSNVKTRLNAESVISSSAQLTTEFDIRYGNELGDNLVSGSAQVKVLLPDGTVSGSAQVKANLPSGTISGSSQVDYDAIVNTPTTITVNQKNAIIANTAKVGYTDSAVKSKLNSEAVVSGSVSFSSVTNKPNGLVSSSAQVTITESQISDLKSYLTAVPSGTISSSAQITALGYSTTDNTGSEQTLTLAGNNLSISNGNTVNLAALAGGGGGGGGSSPHSQRKDSGLGTAAFRRGGVSKPAAGGPCVGLCGAVADGLERLRRGLPRDPRLCARGSARGMVLSRNPGARANPSGATRAGGSAAELAGAPAGLIAGSGAPLEREPRMPGQIFEGLGFADRLEGGHAHGGGGL